MENVKKNAIIFLQSLVNQSLCYGLKSSDMDLYDFGFANLVDSDSWNNELCTHFLHILCRFKVIFKANKQPTKKYYEDTPGEEFFFDIQRLLGLKVRRVALSDKNDLWLDLGDYWVVFATFENDEESWRFFTADTNSPHLVVSNSWLEFQP